MKLGSPLNGKRLLVVDDEPELRRALMFDFRRRGCQIMEAASGSEASKILSENTIDIVISDVRMPDGNGIDLLKFTRTMKPPQPLVILATGYSDITADEALAMGAYAMVEKPFKRDHMLDLVEKAAATLEAT